MVSKTLGARCIFSGRTKSFNDCCHFLFSKFIHQFTLQVIIHFLCFQLLSIFTIISSCFDLYCYAMAAPGSTHYGYYVISYEFVYVGSRHGKNSFRDPIVLCLVYCFCCSAKCLSYVCSVFNNACCRCVCYKYNANNIITKGNRILLITAECL